MGICIIAYMGMVNLLRLSYLDGYIKNYGCDVLPDCFTIFCGRKKESEIEVLSCDETDRIYNKIQKIVKIKNFMSLTDQGD